MVDSTDKKNEAKFKPISCAAKIMKGKNHPRSTNYSINGWQRNESITASYKVILKLKLFIVGCIRFKPSMEILHPSYSRNKVCCESLNKESTKRRRNAQRINLKGVRAGGGSFTDYFVWRFVNSRERNILLSLFLLWLCFRLWLLLLLFNWFLFRVIFVTES